MLSDYELSILVRQYIKCEEFEKANKWLSSFKFIVKRLEDTAENRTPQIILSEWQELESKINFDQTSKEWANFWAKHVFLFERKPNELTNIKLLHQLIWDMSDQSQIKKQLIEADSFKGTNYSWYGLEKKRKNDFKSSWYCIDTNQDVPCCFDYAPECNIIAIGCKKSVILIDLSNNEILFESKIKFCCKKIAISHDGSTFIYTEGDIWNDDALTINIYTMKDSKYSCIRSFKHKHNVSDIDICCNNEIFAFCDSNAKAIIAQIKEDTLIKEIEVDYLSNKLIVSNWKVRFINNAEVLIAGEFDSFRLLQENLLIIKNSDSTGKKDYITRMKEFSSRDPENRISQINKNYGPLNIYDIKSGKCMNVFRDNKEEGFASVVYCQNKNIIVVAFKNCVKIFDATKLSIKITLWDNRNDISTVTISSEGNFVAATDNKTLCVWETDTGEICYQNDLLSNFSHMSFSCDNDSLICMCDDDTIKIISIDKGYNKNPLTCNFPPASVIISNNKIISLSNNFNDITFWNPKTFEIENIYCNSSSRYGYNKLAFSIFTNKGIMGENSVSKFDIELITSIQLNMGDLAKYLNDSLGIDDEDDDSWDFNDETHQVDSLGIDPSAKYGIVVRSDGVSIWDLIENKILHYDMQLIEKHVNFHKNSFFTFASNAAIFGNQYLLLCISDSPSGDDAQTEYLLLDFFSLSPLNVPSIVFEKASKILIKEIDDVIILAVKGIKSYMLVDINSKNVTYGDKEIFKKHKDIYEFFSHHIGYQETDTTFPIAKGPFYTINENGKDYHWAGSGEFIDVERLISINQENHNIRYCIIEDGSQIWFGPSTLINWHDNYFFEKYFSNYQLQKLVKINTTPKDITNSNSWLRSVFFFRTYLWKLFGW